MLSLPPLQGRTHHIVACTLRVYTRSLAHVCNVVVDVLNVRIETFIHDSRYGWQLEGQTD